MTPEEFIRTIYLGDRGCKRIEIDGWNDRVTVTVDVISRVRSASGQWEFYQDEDITDGGILFVGVRRFAIDPPGYVPNDYICELQVETVDAIGNPPIYRFLLTAGGESLGVGGLVTLDIIATGIALLDPKDPDTLITD